MITTDVKKPRKPKKTSPTQRTMQRCRDLGFTVQIVERWNPFAKVRQDLFGCIDLVAMMPGVGIVGIQATSDDNHSKRVDKAIAEPRVKTWLESGGRYEVWSWGLRSGGVRLGRQTWTLRREELVLKGGEVAVATERTGAKA